MLLLPPSAQDRDSGREGRVSTFHELVLVSGGCVCPREKEVQQIQTFCVVQPRLQGTESKARKLVTNHHSCQISASPLTNLSDVCHLSHKSTSKLHLLDSAVSIEFWSSSSEFLLLLSIALYLCTQTTTYMNLAEQRQTLEIVSVL